MLSVIDTNSKIVWVVVLVQFDFLFFFSVGNTVRVTLVQSSVAGGKPVVSQPNYYKPITITSGGVQPVVSATPVSR